jgi:hypothetical protein
LGSARNGVARPRRGEDAGGVRSYGRCPCSGHYEARSVEVTIALDRDEPVVLSDVPQGACDTCGARVYPAAVLSRLEMLMRNRHETVDIA